MGSFSDSAQTQGQQHVLGMPEGADDTADRGRRQGNQRRGHDCRWDGLLAFTCRLYGRAHISRATSFLASMLLV